MSVQVVNNMIFFRFFKKIFIFFLKVKRSISDAVNYDQTIVISGTEILVGKYTYGASHIQILKWSDEGVSVSVGRFCSLSYGLKIFTGGNHRTDWISTYPFGHLLPSSLYVSPVDGHPERNKPVVIENDVWIGRDVTLMSGITVHDGAVIAANSHVVSSVPPYAIVGGNPAKVIRYRFEKDIVTKLLEIKWWNLPEQKILQAHKILCMAPSLEAMQKLEAMQ